MNTRQLTTPLAGLLLLSYLASNAGATNGMNPIASSTPAAGRGGADTAVAEDTAAMNTNPAGITQEAVLVDFSLGLLMPFLTLDDQFTDQSGTTTTLNDGLGSESKIFPLINAGVTAEVHKNLFVGLGFVTQGGMGAEFKDANTLVDDDPTTTGPPVPGTYDTASQVAFMKATPTLAYRFALGDKVDMSVGATLNVGFAKTTFSHSGFQFPGETDNDAFVAHTVDFEGDWTLGYGGRFGALAQFLDGRLAVGASYQSKSNLTHEGTTTLDDQLVYDSEMEFGWPQEVAGGVAGRPIDALRLAFDVRWVNWSSSMDVVELIGTAQGTVPPGYEEQYMPFNMKWDDQIIVALGADFDVSDPLTIRAGYNYGPSAATPTGVNPLFPAVTTHHLTAGSSYEFGDLVAHVAVEYALPHSVTTNDENQLALVPGTTTPSGYQLEVGMSQITTHLGISYKF